MHSLSSQYLLGTYSGLLPGLSLGSLHPWGLENWGPGGHGQGDHAISKVLQECMM